MDSIPLSNDEIETACDALWFWKSRHGVDPDQQALWDRLQPIRHGDNGGDAFTTLTPSEASLVLAALRWGAEMVPPWADRNDEEQRLLDRLSSLA